MPHLLIKTAAGEVLELDIATGCSVADVKAEIANSWKIPGVCQDLVLGTTVLDDCKAVDALCTGEVSDLSLSLVLSIDATCEHLSSNSPDVRREALATIAALGFRGGTQAIVAVSVLLKHSDVKVRSSALDSFLQICPRGEHHGIQAVSSALQDSDLFVRLKAIEVLANISEKGDLATIRAIADLCLDANESIRQTAVQALTMVAEAGAKSSVQDTRLVWKHWPA